MTARQNYDIAHDEKVDRIVEIAQARFDHFGYNKTTMEEISRDAGVSSRIIATKRPGKIRNQHRRTIAEALRRLSQKPQMDDEAKDLAALIVFCLHGIADTVDQTIEAWEKRDYWIKAEHFSREWQWLEPIADELSAVIYNGQWGQLSIVLVGLIPHCTDVTVKQMTCKPVIWRGAYEKWLSGISRGRCDGSPNLFGFAASHPQQVGASKPSPREIPKTRKRLT